MRILVRRRLDSLGNVTGRVTRQLWLIGITSGLWLLLAWAVVGVGMSSLPTVQADDKQNTVSSDEGEDEEREERGKRERDVRAHGEREREAAQRGSRVGEESERARFVRPNAELFELIERLRDEVAQLRREVRELQARVGRERFEPRRDAERRERGETGSDRPVERGQREDERLRDRERNDGEEGGERVERRDPSRDDR